MGSSSGQGKCPRCGETHKSHEGDRNCRAVFIAQTESAVVREVAHSDEGVVELAQIAAVPAPLIKALLQTRTVPPAWAAAPAWARGEQGVQAMFPRLDLPDGPVSVLVRAGDPEWARPSDPSRAATSDTLFKADPADPADGGDEGEGETLATVVCGWLDDVVVNARGLTALAVVVEFGGLAELIPEDVDGQGRPRREAIAPGGLFPEAPRSSFVRVSERADNLPVPVGRVESDTLPLFPEAARSAAPLLLLADAMGIAALQPGRGARVDKRIVIFSLLSMPSKYRVPERPYAHLRPVRWWTDRFYPGRKFRPSESAGRLEIAFSMLGFAKVAMPDGGFWRPVAPRLTPNWRDPDGDVLLHIELPPNCTGGALVQWQPLISGGGISDPALDLWLSLSFLWDEAKRQNGGHRIYATRPRARRDEQGRLLDREGRVILAGPVRRLLGGRVSFPPGNLPVTDWRHPAAVIEGVERHPQADRVPALGRDGRRRLAFPSVGEVSASHLRNQRQRADQEIKRLEALGRVVVEQLAGRLWRILEAVPWR